MAPMREGAPIRARPRTRLPDGEPIARPSLAPRREEKSRGLSGVKLAGKIAAEQHVGLRLSPAESVYVTDHTDFS